MAMSPIRWAGAVVLGLTALGCKPELPAGYDTAAAAAFQERHDELLSGPDSPLGVVDGYYLGAGERLGLRFEGAVLTKVEPSEAATLFEVGADFRCMRGCNEHDGVIAAAVTVSLGRLRLRAAPQRVGDGAGGRVLVADPDAPRLRAHEGLPWFAVDPGVIVAARFIASSDPEPTRLATTRGLDKEFVEAGTLRFTLGGRDLELIAYRGQGQSVTAPMLVPFTDLTTGEQTYAVGRYLEVHARDGVAAIDFNRATNPWCAYSPHYNCPVPEQRNALPIAISAGEKPYPEPAH